MNTYFIFGSTGNLAQNKIIKALFEIYREEKNNFKIYCLGRRDMTDLEFRDFTSKNLEQSQEVLDFLENIFYLKIDIENPKTFSCISNVLDETSPKPIFYLSLPPDQYLKTLEGLKFCGINIQNFILLEKPFASDISSLLKTEQFAKDFLQKSKILYVDHYLFKNIIKDIYNYKDQSVAVGLYENISKIEVSFLESNDISSRGAFYDKVGVVYDVFQNHILEIVSSFLSTKKLSKDRVSVLNDLTVTSSDIKRGQYKGFRDHKGVSALSETETYLKIKILYHSIPIFVEAGKSCKNQNVSLTICYKNGDKKTFNSFTENAYINLFKDLSSGSLENFISFGEALALFKLADEVKENILKIPLEIYDLENGLC